MELFEEEPTALRVALALTDRLVSRAKVLRNTLCKVSGPQISKIVSAFLKTNTLQRTEQSIAQLCVELGNEVNKDYPCTPAISSLAALYLEPEHLLQESKSNISGRESAPIIPASTRIHPSVSILSSLQPRFNTAHTPIVYKHANTAAGKNNTRGPAVDPYSLYTHRPNSSSTPSGSFIDNTDNNNGNTQLRNVRNEVLDPAGYYEQSKLWKIYNGLLSDGKRTKPVHYTASKEKIRPRGKQFDKGKANVKMTLGVVKKSHHVHTESLDRSVESNNSGYKDRIATDTAEKGWKGNRKPVHTKTGYQRPNSSTLVKKSIIPSDFETPKAREDSGGEQTSTHQSYGLDHYFSKLNPPLITAPSTNEDTYRLPKSTYKSLISPPTGQTHTGPKSLPYNEGKRPTQSIDNPKPLLSEEEMRQLPLRQNTSFDNFFMPQDPNNPRSFLAAVPQYYSSKPHSEVRSSGNRMIGDAKNSVGKTKEILDRKLREKFFTTDKKK
jgi:hypothetical protein